MVNRKSGYLLAKGIHGTKFCKFEAKGSKDIEWTSFGLETDRPTNRPTKRLKTICPPFLKGSIKKFSEIRFRCGLHP